ncbi:unnamed protein product [Pieris brassicae]|uniref:Uncharacterized protein n=1 Tax=Pieris brassicae TaxID=7116 RepID=A0A9P0XKP6_PIEBR|nr:unnamed protein product [Pieris brassicae]
MFRSQRLLNLLVVPARSSLHRATEPVQNPLESELLHRESSVAIPLSEGQLPAPATSQPSAADSESDLAEESRCLPRCYCAGPSGPPPTPTRVRHFEERRKLGEAPPPECTAMRSGYRSIWKRRHTRTAHNVITGRIAKLSQVAYWQERDELGVSL